MKRCPHCGHNKFCVTAHVVQEWIVDEYENFINTTEDCIEIAHSPDDEDLWTCEQCGYEGVGREFNVKE